MSINTAWFTEVDGRLEDGRLAYIATDVENAKRRATRDEAFADYVRVHGDPEAQEAADRAQEASERGAGDGSEYARSYPAAMGGTITQGHADYCAEHGHATWTDGSNIHPLCPRCGEDTTPAEAPTLNPGDRVRVADGTGALRWGTVQPGSVMGYPIVRVYAEDGTPSVHAFHPDFVTYDSASTAAEEAAHEAAIQQSIADHEASLPADDERDFH